MSIERHGYCSAVVIKKKTGETKQLALWKHNLLTDAGRDQLHINGYTSTSRSGAGANYIAVTEDTGQTLNAAQTTLTSEITTNGLGRVQATTRSHTTGTNTSTIETTMTASGAFTSVTRSALFDASSTGNMYHIAAYGTASGTLASGDTLKTTWTITLS